MDTPDLSPKQEVPALAVLFRGATRGVLVAHNAKFELQWLTRLGIDTSNFLIFDTQVAEYVLAGNRRRRLGLDATAQRYGLGSKESVIDALLKGGVCPSDMPRHWLVDRVIKDVETTKALAKLQIAEAQRLGLLPTIFTRCILTPVLADIEGAGITLDHERVKIAHTKAVTRLAEIERDLELISGGINLRSGIQLAELLYDNLGFKELTARDGKPKRTATGRRLTDSETLEKLRAKTAEQKRFIHLRQEWGKVSAAITKSLEFFRHVCDEDKGVLFGRYNQTVTQTHRLSSSGRKRKFSDGFEGGCQFQNLPNEYKGLFKAGNPGQGALERSGAAAFTLVETDGSGIEFRVAAGVAQDPQAIADILADADIHRYTASILCDKPEAEVTKEERREAKQHTFKPLYGGQSGTPRQKAYYEAFKKKYAKIAATQNGWVLEVLRTRELLLPWGMRFYWPLCSKRADGYVPETPNIYNYPIQSLATAEIVLIALTYLHWRIRVSGVRARLINTVHDSAIAEVHKEDVAEYKDIAVTAFLDDVYEYLARVYQYEWQNPPLGIGINVAEHWAEGVEEKISKPSPYLIH